MGDNGPSDGELPPKRPKTPRNATAVAAAVATARNDEGGAFCCPQRDSRVNTPGVAGAAAGAAAAAVADEPGDGELPSKRAKTRKPRSKAQEAAKQRLRQKKREQGKKRKGAHQKKNKRK